MDQSYGSIHLHQSLCMASADRTIGHHTIQKRQRPWFATSRRLVPSYLVLVLELGKFSQQMVSNQCSILWLILWLIRWQSPLCRPLPLSRTSVTGNPHCENYKFTGPQSSMLQTCMLSTEIIPGPPNFHWKGYVFRNFASGMYGSTASSSGLPLRISSVFRFQVYHTMWWVWRIQMRIMSKDSTSRLPWLRTRYRQHHPHKLVARGVQHNSSPVRVIPQY